MANNRKAVSSQSSAPFQELILRARLILRLMGDRRVSIFLKLLPVAAAIYVISPIDLLPGAVVPVLGVLDDALAIWLGTTLFVSLCPDEVVKEHLNALHNVVPGTWREAPEADESGAIVEGESQTPGDDNKNH